MFFNKNIKTETTQTMIRFVLIFTKVHDFYAKGKKSMRWDFSVEKGKKINTKAGLP